MSELPLQARLLARRMAVTALVLCALAFLAKMSIGTAFTEGALFTFDDGLAQSLRRLQTPGWLAVMRAISAVHGTVGILILNALLAVWLWRRDWRLWAMRVAFVAPAGLLLNVAVKNMFARTRPAFDGVAASLHSFSFPSGHTAEATVFYGLVVAIVFGLSRKAAPRVLAVLGATLLVLAVAASRMYLGAHYASDVTGAVVEGLVWLLGCLAPWPNVAAADATRQPAPVVAPPTPPGTNPHVEPSP